MEKGMRAGESFRVDPPPNIFHFNKCFRKLLIIKILFK